jgi:ATP-dependent exoDNAse (exonuclease V) beta subunit
LCKLPANQFLDTTADDGVLVQGAIDLLATGKNGTAIIDYKYSKRADDYLVSHYSAQLSLYKKAVATILKINEDTISTTIVNIFYRRQIQL